MTDVSVTYEGSPAGTPMVKAEGVCKSFGRLEVLKGIDLEVARGEVMCILGPSGSGKSTFLRCINHLEKLTAGLLSVDGDLVGYVRKDDRLVVHPNSTVIVTVQGRAQVPPLQMAHFVTVGALRID